MVKEIKELAEELLPDEKNKIKELKTKLEESEKNEEKIAKRLHHLIITETNPMYYLGEGRIIHLKEYLRAKLRHEKQSQELMKRDMEILEHDIKDIETLIKHRKMRELKRKLMELGLIQYEKAKQKLEEEMVV
jgi:hypothetical protein